MSKRLMFLLNLFLFQNCYFLRPFWGNKEWKYVLQFFGGKAFPEAVSRLEQKVCELTGAQYALGINLGRSAIQVALEAFDLPSGSEVILPSFSCTGVIMPVIQAGLKPVLGDVDQDFNLSAESVQEGLSPKTRAIILPHLSGKGSRDTDKILKLAHELGLKVIEDACQSFGLKIKGKWTGTFGDVGIFSFGPGKNLFGPGGGMLVTNDEGVISRCQSRLLPREDMSSVRTRLAHFVWRFGLQRWTFPLSFVVRYIRGRLAPDSPISDSLEHYTYPVSRISEIEAILALCQVERYQEIIRRRQANARALLTFNLFKKAGLQAPNPTDHIFTKFLVTTGNDQERAAHLRKLFNSRGVETESSYIPLHLRSPFNMFKRTNMVETEKRWRGAFSIPVNPQLGKRDMDRTIRILNKF